MEQLNRIELMGIVRCVRHSSVGDRELSLFTVATFSLPAAIAEGEPMEDFLNRMIAE